MSSQFFETWVVSEIFKSCINNGKRPPLYFYRDSNRKEIDLIIWQYGRVYPKTEIGSGAVVCMAKDVLPIDNKNWYVSAWLI